MHPSMLDSFDDDLMIQILGHYIHFDAELSLYFPCFSLQMFKSDIDINV